LTKGKMWGFGELGNTGPMVGMRVVTLVYYKSINVI